MKITKVTATVKKAEELFGLCTPFRPPRYCLEFEEKIPLKRGDIIIAKKEEKDDDE